MYVLVRAGLYPGLSVYCLLLTASPVLQSICSGVREILFRTSVLVEQRVCVHPLFVLYCIVYYKRVCVHPLFVLYCIVYYKRVCVHPLFVLYCIVYYKRECVSVCVLFACRGFALGSFFLSVCVCCSPTRLTACCVWPGEKFNLQCPVRTCAFGLRVRVRRGRDTGKRGTERNLWGGRRGRETPLGG